MEKVLTDAGVTLSPSTETPLGGMENHETVILGGSEFKLICAALTSQKRIPVCPPSTSPFTAKGRFVEPVTKRVRALQFRNLNAMTNVKLQTTVLRDCAG